ncbi:hypothetical protein [Shimazuella kribbensis]|uniref:hypothetical protein n=1 Tax=Shimazuella kribbensis TaxID=139808 RepID=UPI0004295EC7|nr:hypothetical protein [Shimazuella kribbensis]
MSTDYPEWNAYVEKQKADEAAKVAAELAKDFITPEEEIPPAEWEAMMDLLDEASASHARLCAAHKPS